MTNQTYPGAMLLTNESYHADTSHISKSGMDLIERSPAHYWARYLDPNRVPEPPKKHFVVGSITHTAILEPQYLEQHYFILDDAAKVAEIGGGNPRGTTRYKEWKAEELQKANGRQEVSIDDWNKVRRMREQVFSHQGAAYLLQQGYAEQSFFFTEPSAGAPCKIRPDWLNHHVRWAVDVKTTDDASPAGFGKSFFNFGYDKQAALILDGLALIEGMPWEGIAFIAVEKEPPHAVAVYYATADDIERGRIRYRGNLQTYMECRERGQWPAYSQGVEPIMRPGWIK